MPLIISALLQSARVAASLCFVVSMLLMHSPTCAQPIRVIVRASFPPDSNPVDSIYLTGNFNNWKPADAAYAFQKSSDTTAVVSFVLPTPDAYECKITRGSWETVQCAASGADVANTRFRVVRDTVLNIRVEAWRDKTPALPLTSTASAHVSCIRHDFDIPQLHRKRAVWIYLPSDYARSGKRYPVLYMHDAQNLFDRSRNGYGEWGVDETIDSVIHAGGPACLVVGIDHGGAHRLSEYSPFDFKLNGQLGVNGSIHGEGDAYVDFLVHTLKPYIDSAYRTRKDKNSTFIAGSSMGGLISFYALSRYPDVFSKAGVFSPAFWTVRDTLLSYLQEPALHVRGEIFFTAGALEGNRYADDMMGVSALLRDEKNTVVQKVEVVPWGAHHESFWQNRFPQFYMWLFSR